jgi:drug/metabolite transporter (DMT)-like permease
LAEEKMARNTNVSSAQQVQSPFTFLSVGAAILLQSSAMCFAKQAGLVSSGKGVAALVINPWYLAEIAALGFQALCWIMALRKLPLSFAYPFMSLVFVVNLLFAGLIFREEVHMYNGVGIMFIVCGVTLIAQDVPK